jgi:hypothetical protein
VQQGAEVLQPEEGPGGLQVDMLRREGSELRQGSSGEWVIQIQAGKELRCCCKRVA